MSLTLCEMNEEKALGPDMLTTWFWQFCWEKVKADILRMFRDFHETGKFVRSLNRTFIVMIPKKGELRTSRILDLLVWWEVYISY